MNIRKLLEDGQAAQNAAHKSGEAAKLGNLRGGSAGVIGTDGEIYGECHRIALARMLGIDKEVDPDRHVMFDAGNDNEDIWAAKLTAAGVVFRREEEYPVVFPVPGTNKKATGRPDIVIGTETVREPTVAERSSGLVGPHCAEVIDFTPTIGLELKGIFSKNTAKAVELDGVPQSKHLVQSAFYSMALNIPYVLCYTSASVWHLDSKWDRQNYGGLEKIQPFYRMFYLEWRDDTLWYRDEHEDVAVKTKITKQGIVDFYKLIAEMEETKQLGPRPNNGHVNGSKGFWNRCDPKYCAFALTCDATEHDYDAWIASL